MTKILATGSQLDRVARCEASAALPQIVDANDEDREDRTRGSAMHKFLERVPEVGRETSIAEADEKHRAFLESIELAKLADRLSLSREVAIAYNFVADTARVLTPVAPRAYEIDSTCEIAMTLDLVGVGDDAVYVGDYKSGHAWLPAPEASYQLGAGALAVARLYRKSKAIIEYIRIRDDGSPRRFSAMLDVFGLDGVAMRLGELLADIPARRAAIAGGEVPDVVEGRWCRYCPARQHCPAKTALIRHVLSDPQPVPYLLPLTPESAQRAYKLLRPAKDALAQIEAALYAYAKTTPIPLGQEEDGSLRFFGELRRPGSEVLDGAITHRVLTERYGGEAANEAVTMETTKKAIADVARKNLKVGEDGKPEKITKVTEAIYKRIGELGGSKHPETCTTIEYTVSPEGETKARKRKAG